MPFPESEGAQSVFTPQESDNAIVFAETFTALQGKFVFCNDIQEAAMHLEGLLTIRNWKKIYCKNEELHAQLFPQMQLTDNLAGCDAAVTNCEFLVARTGSIVLSAAQDGGRTASVYAPAHICIASSSQLVYDVKDALQAIGEKYNENLPSFITFASGPSRTADIEKTLVTGVHGPKEVYCYLVDAPF